MSLLFRGEAGDEIASFYGPYLTPSVEPARGKGRASVAAAAAGSVHSVRVGEKLDMLCGDGLNYQVSVKAVKVGEGEGEGEGEAEGVVWGHLHFCHWSARTDYRGDLRRLYLARPAGVYSAGIGPANSYTAWERDMKRQQREQQQQEKRRRDAKEKQQGVGVGAEVEVGTSTASTTGNNNSVGSGDEAAGNPEQRQGGLGSGGSGSGKRRGRPPKKRLEPEGAGEKPVQGRVQGESEAAAVVAAQGQAAKVARVEGTVGRCAAASLGEGAASGGGSSSVPNSEWVAVAGAAAVVGVGEPPEGPPGGSCSHCPSSSSPRSRGRPSLSLLPHQPHPAGVSPRAGGWSTPGISRSGGSSGSGSGGEAAAAATPGILGHKLLSGLAMTMQLKQEPVQGGGGGGCGDWTGTPGALHAEEAVVAAALDPFPFSASSASANGLLLHRLLELRAQVDAAIRSAEAAVVRDRVREAVPSPDA